MGDITFKVSSGMIEKNNTVMTISSNNVNKDDYDYFLQLKERSHIYGYGELAIYANNNLLNLLTSGVSKNPRSLRIVTDEDFLTALTNMINAGDLSLSREYINRYNRIYRAYLLDPERNVIYSQKCANLMRGIIYYLNKDVVESLKETGIGEDYALMITVNRYSSTEERRNIRHTIRYMQHIDQNIMTEQMVINIFAKLFNDSLTNLFCAVMTDRFDDFDDYNEEYVYSTVSNALLDILNTMEVDEIKDILMEYISELEKSGSIGRFRLNSINSDDYNNITTAIEEIEKMGIYVY